MAGKGRRPSFSADHAFSPSNFRGKFRLCIAGRLPELSRRR
jgi:hypothetical protein